MLAVLLCCNTMNHIEPLPDRWKLFAEAYCIDFTVTRAAETANVPLVSAYAMMSDPRVQAVIKDAKRKASDRVQISIDNTLEQLRMIANGNVIDVLDALGMAEGETLAERLRKLPPETQYAIKSIKWTKNGPEIVMHDKVKAVELIGKYFGIFSDKLELSGPGGLPVMITNGMTPKEAADAYAATLTGN